MAIKVSLAGQINGSGTWADSAGTDLALFLKLFGHEVLATFRQKTVMDGLTRVRNITSGKSATFPVYGQAVARYHTPGTSLLRDTNNDSQEYKSVIPTNERVITVDDLLTASILIDNLDAARSHWDIRSEYAGELGGALQRKLDTHLIALAVLASRGSATVTGGYGGSVLTDSSVTGSSNRKNMTAANFDTLLANAQRRFDDKDVPEEDRFVVVEPWLATRYANSDVGKAQLNRDYNESMRGDFGNTKLMSARGFKILKSNLAKNIFGANVSAAKGEQNTYSGDFRCTNAVCFQRSALGTVKLLDLALEMEYLTEYQAHFAVAKFALGHGILRPESAIAIRVTPDSGHENGVSTDADGSI